MNDNTIGPWKLFNKYFRSSILLSVYQLGLYNILLKTNNKYATIVFKVVILKDNHYTMSVIQQVLDEFNEIETNGDMKIYIIGQLTEPDKNYLFKSFDTYLSSETLTHNNAKILKNIAYFEHSYPQLLNKFFDLSTHFNYTLNNNSTAKYYKCSNDLLYNYFISPTDIIIYSQVLGIWQKIDKIQAMLLLLQTQKYADKKYLFTNEIVQCIQQNVDIISLALRCIRAKEVCIGLDTTKLSLRNIHFIKSTLVSTLLKHKKSVLVVLFIVSVNVGIYLIKYFTEPNIECTLNILSDNKTQLQQLIIL